MKLQMLVTGCAILMFACLACMMCKPGADNAYKFKDSFGQFSQAAEVYYAKKGVWPVVPDDFMASIREPFRTTIMERSQACNAQFTFERSSSGDKFIVRATSSCGDLRYTTSPSRAKTNRLSFETFFED